MKKRTDENRILTVPNVLTTFRILLLPALMWLYIGKENYLWATIILVISGATDVVDGWIARKFNAVTTLGKALDPFADKASQIVILICLASRWKHMILLLIVLLIKEAFVISTSWVAAHAQKYIKGAEWYGKLATVVLFFAILPHIFWLDIPLWLSDTLIIISAATAVLSMVLYGIRNFRYIREAKAEQTKE